jgi:hypothetical protein
MKGKGMRFNARTLVFGLFIGLVIGGITVSAVPLSAPSQSTEAPSHQTSYSNTGPSCYDGNQSNSGWLHVMANGERWAITFDTTILHPEKKEVNLDVFERPTGTYEFAFKIVESDSTPEPRDEDCRIATTLTVVTALEKPDFVVTVDDRTVQSVDQEDTMPELYQLPNPINASKTNGQ